MSERYLHSDGTEVSLSHAYVFIQNLANNAIRNITRIITESAGFLEDSFKPVALEKDTTSDSIYCVKLKVGSVVFPNGEVFFGKSFTCNVSFNKLATIQYLTIRHVELHQTEQKQAFGAEGYANIYDGVKLEISESPELSEDGSGLLIASINYLPDMDIPEITDLRDPWVFFWSPSTIINPIEVVNADIGIFISSNSLQDKGVCILTSPDINSEFEIIQQITQELDSSRHAWDIQVQSEIPEILLSKIISEPFTEIFGPLHKDSGDNYMALRPLQGLKAVLRMRKHDAYRDITTEWDESDEYIVSYLEPEEIVANLDYIIHDTQPLVGIKIYTEEELNAGFYIQFWISENEGSVDENTRPHHILPLPHSITDPAEIPYFLFPYDKSAEKIFTRYRIMSPGHRKVKEGEEEITFPKNNYSDEEVLEIPFSADRQDIDTDVITTDDENGRFLYYGKAGIIHFKVPQSQEWPETGFPTRYLSRIEFKNYANYPTWGENTINFEHFIGGEVIIGPFSSDIPIEAGTNIIITVTSNAGSLALGTYAVNYTYNDSGWYLSITPGAGVPGNGTCSIENSDNVPRAELEIKNISTRDGETYGPNSSHGFDTFRFGQDHDIHFPNTFYSDSWSAPLVSDYEFREGNTYEIRLYHDTGGYSNRMQANGSLKLFFKKSIL